MSFPRAARDPVLGSGPRRCRRRSGGARGVRVRRASAPRAVVAGYRLAAGRGGDARILDDLVTANRVLAQERIVDGYGHVSARSAERPGRFFLSRALAPALVTARDLIEYDLDGKPVEGGGRDGYVERFLHAAIYRARTDVGAIVHCHTPSLIPFAALERAAAADVPHERVPHARRADLRDPRGSGRRGDARRRRPNRSGARAGARGCGGRADARPRGRRSSADPSRSPSAGASTWT